MAWKEIDFSDAQQAMGFILPQQYRIETEVYQIRYPSFDYAALLPVNNDGDMWDIGSVFFSGDIAGKAEFLSAKGFDMPFADVSESQFIRQNYLAGIGYEWDLGTLKRAQKMGRDLPAAKARAARKVAEAFIYGIAIRGHTEKGWTGLVNLTSVPTANVPADGTGATTGWATKTPDQIMRDVNLVLNDVYNNTGEVHVANTLALPSTALQYANGLRIGDGADTLMKFIKENNAYTLATDQPLKIVATRELETAGASSTRRMVAYDRAPEVIQFHIPGAHEFLDPFQKSSMTWEVAGIMNIGGTELRLPKAMSYRDGI